MALWPCVRSRIPRTLPINDDGDDDIESVDHDVNGVNDVNDDHIHTSPCIQLVASLASRVCMHS